MAEKTIKYDVDGYDAVTTALMELLNQYPGLSPKDEIAFSSLGSDGGKAMFPIGGAVVEVEKRNVLGKITKTCLYPFHIVYRASGLNESRKVKVKEWLDTLGKWLEQQEVTIDGTVYQLDELPPLTDGRAFLDIARQTSAHWDSTNDNKSENWVVAITARYHHEYYK